MIGRLKNRWKRWRGRNRETPITKKILELREFVYLDEVSVVSLLSSRLGKLPNEFTETLSKTSKSEVNAALEANASVVKSKLGSRLEDSETKDTKVVSKATIQATFKRLYENEEQEGTLLVQPAGPHESVPDREQAEAVLRAAPSTDSRPWRISAGQLARGQLVEFEVELQADSVFRMSTIVAIFAELADESKDVLGRVNQSEFERMIEFNRVLEKLMVGLVPLKCRMVDYLAVDDGLDSFLIHRQVLEQMAPDTRPETRDVYLVGVAERALFWKDIRRLLFSKWRFRVLCRLNQSGLSSSWTPVKLVDVLSEVAPDLGGSIDLFGPEGLNAIAAQSKRDKFVAPRVGALVTYAELVSEEVGFVMTKQDREAVEILAGENADFIITVPEGRKAFTAVGDFIAERASKSIDSATAVRLRTLACRQHDLYPGGSPIQSHQPSPRTAPSRGNEAFLNAEIIAIYW